MAAILDNRYPYSDLSVNTLYEIVEKKRGIYEHAQSLDFSRGMRQ
jgi:hypothetical protein